MLAPNAHPVREGVKIHQSQTHLTQEANEPHIGRKFFKNDYREAGQPSRVSTPMRLLVPLLPYPVGIHE